MRSKLFLVGLGLAGLYLNPLALAINLDWSGVYRLEALALKNSLLNDSEKINENKNYSHHHMILRPRAIVADGISVHGQFNLFNNATLANSQFGQFFGNGVDAATATSTDDSNVLGQTQADEVLRVTQLYLKYRMEFIEVIAGRAPLNFGLGLTHNAGLGEFDHWYDNRDMVATKISFGNLSLTPRWGKVSEGSLDFGGDDVRDYIIQMDYENLETQTGFGLFWQWRRSGQSGNDFPGAGLGLNRVSGFEGQSINFYLKRGFDELNFHLEGGFSRGGTGFHDANSVEVDLNGFGLALEADYKPEGSRWSWKVQTGFAQGDDPSTTDKIESFFFDRNYDVGLLLFNHVFGQFDALSTSLARNAAFANALSGSASATGAPDIESLSNAIYLAPTATYQTSDKWSLGGRLVWATLVEDNVLINGTATSVDKALGFELDFSLQFRPHDRFTWVTELGLLFPGSAFKGGANGFETKFSYGLITKAAVSF